MFEPITIVGCWNGPVKGLGEPPITNCASSPVTAGSCPLIKTVVFTVGRMILVPGWQGKGLRGLIFTPATSAHA